jgi:hypothetical protein
LSCRDKPLSFKCKKRKQGCKNIGEMKTILPKVKEV